MVKIPNFCLSILRSIGCTITFSGASFAKCKGLKFVHN